MYRVEGVIGILQDPVVIPLFSAIQPDRNQSKQRKSLSGQILCFSEQFKHIRKTAEHFHIDIPQTDQLSEIIPPFPAAEKIENKNGQDSRMVEIHKRYDADNVTEQDRCCTDGNTSEQFTGLFGFFVQNDQTDRDQKCP